VKDKPIAIVITLLGGAISIVSCLINNTPPLITLIIVLVSLLAFMIIGIVAHKIYAKIKDEMEIKAAQEKNRLESEAFERERRENERALAAMSASQTEPEEEPREPVFEEPKEPEEESEE